ncbi:hypothetical protein HPP92_008131 [Vanilla planifolia]|uniref:Uncharacterized protein n=1 Tax=Vanilla planifolia TaxID=51239 RepID=A0A835V1U5_VANPL|nr:hypothetical protein HPP92_008288 [Vanilla planifolia]KAG0486036.1 hypothetical protein HPP92_008131 [Vanilla planifolia]
MEKLGLYSCIQALCLAFLLCSSVAIDIRMDIIGGRRMLGNRIGVSLPSPAANPSRHQLPSIGYPTSAE